MPSSLISGPTWSRTGSFMGVGGPLLWLLISLYFVEQLVTVAARQILWSFTDA
jgi:hypothetical protein